MPKSMEKTRSKRIVETTQEVFASSSRYYLEEYLKMVEDFLGEEEDSFRKKLSRMEDKIKQLPPEEQENFKEFLIQESYKYSIDFPRILHNSCLLIAISSLEFELSIICKNLKEQRNIPISWKELRGGTLEQAKRFCEIARINLAKDNTIWEEIQNIYRIRNCIVHNNGYIKGSKDEKKLNAYVKEKGIISQDEDKQLDLTKQFCEETIKAIDGFTLSIWDVINKLRPMKVRGVYEALGK